MGSGVGETGGLHEPTLWDWQPAGVPQCQHWSTFTVVSDTVGVCTADY